MFWRVLVLSFVCANLVYAHTDEIVERSLKKVLQELDDWEHATTQLDLKNTQLPRPKATQNTPQQTLTVNVSNEQPLQGETVSITIRSATEISKCFGDIGGKAISFVDVGRAREYQGFVGFGIHHYTGKLKILLAILFRDGTLQYISKNIEVRERYLPKVRAWVYKKHRSLVKYKKRGRWRRRWKTHYKKSRHWITPPKNENDFTHTSLGDFQKEIKDQLIDSTEKGEALGGGTEKYEGHSDLIEKKLQEEDFKETALFDDLYKIQTPYKFYDGRFYQPLYPAKASRVSGFGKYRVFQYRGQTRRGYHKGLDIAQPKGTLLHAPNHGIVVLARRFRARGNVVMIDHGAGVYSLQYHLSDIVVKEGVFVRKGEVVGRVGSTGISTGPHLHWEMRVHGVAVNPLQWRNIE